MRFPIDIITRLITFLQTNTILGIRVREDGGALPPWTVTPDFDGEQWVCSIAPGLVNGLPAVWDGVDLLDAPVIPITNYRSLGPDATPTLSVTLDGEIIATYEEVPPYFLALGVGKPPTTSFDPFAGGFSTALDYDSRLLRCADLVLHQGRMSATTDIIIGDPASGSPNVVEYVTKVEGLLTANDPATIEQTEKYSPPQDNDPTAIMLGLLEEQKEDQIHIASVWFVSPPGWPRGTPIDASWDVHVQQLLWWDLDHSIKEAPPQLAHTALRLDTVLAGGVANPINDYLTSQINDADSLFAQFFNKQDTPGKFWSV